MDATVKVRLRNRVLQVPAEDKEKYLQQGYTVYDMDGHLIAERRNCIPDGKAERGRKSGGGCESKGIQSVRERHWQCRKVTEAAL